MRYDASMENTTTTSTLERIMKLILIIVGVVALFLLFFVGYAFIQSPAAIRQPQFEHAHFRMQLLIDGKSEDFGADRYQAAYKPQQCSDELADEPIHFHDKKDQFVHLHWKDITGGMILKYYGWNFIGGLGDALGYRFDGLQNFKAVPLYGKVLPPLPRDAKLYVYTGDETEFQQRNINDFLYKDLETFFGKKSHIQPEDSMGFWDILSTKAMAHGNEVHAVKNEAELTRINNLLGNVVIFAQKDAPTQVEVQARFMQLVPLSESTCSG